MRNKFIDLINAGVASINDPATVKDMSPIDLDIQRKDSIIQQYNTHWGMISNTQLQYDPECEGCYIIVGGSNFTNQDWDRFCYSYSWGGYEFRFIDGSGINRLMSMSEWASLHGLYISPGSVRGDARGFLRPTPEDKQINIGQTYTTSESQIPRPLFELETVKGAIQKAFQKENIKEILEALNSEDVLAYNWQYVNEKFVGMIRDKKYVIIETKNN